MGVNYDINGKGLSRNISYKDPTSDFGLISKIERTERVNQHSDYGEKVIVVSDQEAYP